MRLNKKWLLLILGIIVSIIIIFPKAKEHIDYQVDSVNLTIYGLSAEPRYYNLDKDQ